MRSCDGRQSNSIFCEKNCHAWANPLPKQMITCSQPATTKTRTEKNKTIWLILNDCLPDYGAGCQLYFFQQSKLQPVWATLFPLSFWMRLYSLLVSGHYTLNDLSSGLWPEKKTDKTKHWQECCRVVGCQCVRWMETPMYTFDMICDWLNERGTLRGFFWVLPSEIKAL